MPRAPKIKKTIRETDALASLNMGIAGGDEYDDERYMYTMEAKRLIRQGAVKKAQKELDKGRAAIDTHLEGVLRSNAMDSKEEISAEYTTLLRRLLKGNKHLSTEFRTLHQEEYTVHAALKKVLKAQRARSASTSANTTTTTEIEGDFEKAANGGKRAIGVLLHTKKHAPGTKATIREIGDDEVESDD